MAYEPSLKVVHALLDPETHKALSLPLAALITGALAQVETNNRTHEPSLRFGISPFNQDDD